MKKTIARSVCTVAIFGVVLTGCSKSDDVVGRCGKRSFSTNLTTSTIKMTSVRGYDGMSNTTKTMTGSYHLAGTNNSEIIFTDNRDTYVFSTNKNIKDRPKSVKIYTNASLTQGDTYSIGSVC